MIIYNLAFYLFAGVIVFSAFMVVFAQNPVHSVLFLILTFFNSAALFILRGAEFLAMSLVIVYVGAVAVLFLFVVMMLDIQVDHIKRKFGKYSVIGAGVGIVLFAEIILAVYSYNGVQKSPADLHIGNNTEEIGILLFTEYAYVFEAVGMILLVAMLGAIVLTLRQRPGVKKQNIFTQNTRDGKSTVTLQDPTKSRTAAKKPTPKVKKKR